MACGIPSRVQKIFIKICVKIMPNSLEKRVVTIFYTIFTQSFFDAGLDLTRFDIWHATII